MHCLTWLFCTFCREENCHWCLYVYLPVLDCCTSGRKPSAKWGRRDNKVRLPPLLDSAMKPNASVAKTAVFIYLLFIFSHLMGMFYRTIRMLENGIKPVYVFDGKPPQLKSSEVSLGSLAPNCAFCYYFGFKIWKKKTFWQLKSDTFLLSLTPQLIFVLSWRRGERGGQKQRSSWQKPRKLVRVFEFSSAFIKASKTMDVIFTKRQFGH